MKREVPSDAMLDSLDDAMLDEITGLSPPHTPRCSTPQSPLDVIRGASPVNSPATRVLTLSQRGGGISPICGDSPIRGDHNAISSRRVQGAMPFTDAGAFSFGGGSQLSAMWSSAAPAVSMEMKPELPLTWSSVAADQVLQCDQPPNLSAMERRRQKNRECMRRARQKQREELKDMKATVARLEKQYAQLSVQAASSGDSGALVASGRMATEYSEAVELTRRLGAENLYLKAEIQQQQMWKANLSRLLQSTVEADGPRWAQQFQQPSLGGEEVLRMQLDKMDDADAREELGFHALSDLELTHVILENRRTIERVQSKLLVPSSLDTDGGARTRRMQAFGWDMVQRVHGSVMECVFTKKFRGLDVAQLMQRTWANDMRLGEFKKVKGETCRLEVLQQVNPNAYVLCRDVMSPTTDISIFRSVFVRFLIETSKKIPAAGRTSTCIDASAPSTPPQYAESDSDSEELMLEASGYVLGTQSVDTDYSRTPRPEDVFNKVAWAHLCLSIEFLNVVNPVTGEEYQQLCWSARTNYCGPEHAQRNASDMMQGMLRWELLVISPAVNLLSLSQE